MPGKTVCLIGNGVSLSYNRNLSVASLTEKLIKKFKKTGGDLGVFAGKVEKGRNGFEELLGPYDVAAAALASLPGFGSSQQEGILAKLPGSNDDTVRGLKKKIQGVEQALGKIYRDGVGMVLELIARQTAKQEGDYTNIVGFCRALSKIGEVCDLTIGTLNYDGLLHSGMLEAGKGDLDEGDEMPNLWGLEEFMSDGLLADDRNSFAVTDLADGRQSDKFAVTGDGKAEKLEAHPLRRMGDFPDERAVILQLHGSLGWLRRRGHGGHEFWKFKIEDLRKSDYWNQWRAGNSEWEPVVVLTNQKGEAIARWPFVLAYELFRQRIEQADRLLIAGYGLGDEPVNAVLKQVLRKRKEKLPAILVVDSGDESRRTDVTERAVKELGVSRKNLKISLDGVPGVIDTPEWSDWAEN